MHESATKVRDLATMLPAAETSGTFKRITFWAVRLLAVLGALVLIGVLLVPRFVLPAEDAVILFQFSRNLAHTAAITYIPHGPHAEGATDFAWMVFLALGIKLGLEPFWLAAITNGVSLIALAVLLLKMAGRRVRAVPMFAIMGVFALLPQLFAATAGFSTLPFALLLVSLAFAFTRGNEVAIPLISLLLCLFRPDGVVFAIPLMVAALIISPNRLRALMLDVAFFLIPGTLYFLWRWHYFSEMLPLPFLVKSDAHRVGHVFVMGSVQALAPYWIAALVLLWLTLNRSIRDKRNIVVMLCLVILPNFFYMAMRLDQNIGDRFFIYLPVGVAVLVAMNWNQEHAPKLMGVSLLLWICLFAMHDKSTARSFVVLQFDNRRAIAEDLAKLPQGVMVVTEAGILPYYSHWVAYDAWGLNTATFAKRLFQPSDVADLQPDLILLYTGSNIECFLQPDWKTPYTDRNWTHLTRNMVQGAVTNNYELWLAPFGNTRFRSRQDVASWQGDQECWYVRRSSALHVELEKILSKHGAITSTQYGLLRPKG